jgi:hypothetical protein
MPRLPLASMVAAARRFGLAVEVVPGAEVRGSSAFAPVVFVGHHTAGPRSGTRPSLQVVVDGRADLAGPLCNWYLDRDGVCVIVATGVANHAGAGGYRGVTGNSRAQGCEAESAGAGDDWTPRQLWAYPRVVAAGLTLMSGGPAGPDAYCSHRTWAPTRKIDPAGISDDWMRAQVAAVMGNPTPAVEDEDMFTDADRAALQAIHSALATAVQPGQKTFAGTIASIGGNVQNLINRTNALAGQVAQVGGKVDAAQVAVIAAITAADPGEVASWTDAQRAQWAGDIARQIRVDPAVILDALAARLTA